MMTAIFLKTYIKNQIASFNNPFDLPAILVPQVCAWDSCRTIQLCLSLQHAFPSLLLQKDPDFSLENSSLIFSHCDLWRWISPPPPRAGLMRFEEKLNGISVKVP